MLRYLAQRRGHVVDKERFIEDIWQGRAVTDGSLAKCVEELREAVGEDAARLIRTVRGRGYILDTIDPPCDDNATSATAVIDDATLSAAAPFDTDKDHSTERAVDEATMGLAGSTVDAPARAGALRRRRGVVAAITCAAALLVTSWFVSSGLGRDTAPQAVTSLAVLPFANGTDDPGIDYVADGITASVIHRLSRLTGLRVISHTAVLHVRKRGGDTQAIARDLGVGSVLTGRLVKRDTRLALALELLDARDNRHLWGHRYEVDLREVATMEQAIPVDLVEYLRLTLSASSRQQLARTYTDNADAHQLYLKGRYAWEKWTVQGSKQAVAYFEEAIKRDPEYALAYAGLADAYLFGLEAGAGLPRKEAQSRGRAAAMKALYLDPQLAEAHAALGLLLMIDWDFPAAEKALSRALELNPNYAEAHHLYSHLLLSLGRIDESLRESRTFQALDPVSESPIGHLAWHYLWARQYDDSIAWSLKDRQIYPDAPQPTLCDAYYAKGMHKEVADCFYTEHARRLTPAENGDLKSAFARSGLDGLFRVRITQLKAVADDERDDVDIAALHSRLGEVEQAFLHLERAYTLRSSGMSALRADVRFDNVRGDPRFADLLRRIGLPPLN
ncbi:Transcriptional regulator HilA [Luteitalea pratensis]|uniref:Transcriptional regulator HilA n=1 Tax=Luteitalea pratensis TaxID=1855912 RepID=A0A143PGT1_LUTPR|nr:Transcriptional regulator HilA [Luteitalea pratensis]